MLPEDEEHVDVSHLIEYLEEGYFGFGSRTFSSGLRFQDSLPCRFFFLTQISWFVSEFSILMNINKGPTFVSSSNIFMHSFLE